MLQGFGRGLVVTERQWQWVAAGGSYVGVQGHRRVWGRKLSVMPGFDPESSLALNLFFTAEIQVILQNP